MSRCSSQDPSVITDAGDQAELQHRRAQPQSSGSGFDLTRSLALLKLTSRHELQESILEAYQRTRDDRSFLPKGELIRLITPDSVARELATELRDILTPAQIRAYADVVCAETTVERNGKEVIKSYRKIFALLVIAELSSMILLFLEEDVSDLDLPLTPIKSPGIKGFSRKGSDIPLSCFDHDRWSPMKLHNFHDHQWKMLATYFKHDARGDVKHYVLRDRHILPFVALDEAGEHDTEVIGGYGRVFMVHIHQDHHNFPDDTSRENDPGYAIKQQMDADREAFEKEVNILKKFAGARGHKHIVCLLATYEHSGKFHLIFPRAEGNLLKFWKEFESQPAFEYRNIVWVAKQCKGIAEGLFRLHRYLTLTKVVKVSAKSPEPLSPGMSNLLTASQPTQSQYLSNSGSYVMTADHLKTISRQCTLTFPAESNDDDELPSRRVRFDSVADQTNSNIHQTNGMNKPSTDSTSAPHEPHMSMDEFPASPTYMDGNDKEPPKVYGRHGDINPGNMLWFDCGQEPDGVLRGMVKIADFGQAELNSHLSKTKHGNVATTLTYRPPESDLPTPIIRQEYDIWCLGCVYLEFITWILGGSKLLAQFARDRLAPDYFHDKQETDTFFQMVQDPETLERKVEVKEKVLQVSIDASVL